MSVSKPKHVRILGDFLYKCLALRSLFNQDESDTFWTTFFAAADRKRFINYLDKINNYNLLTNGHAHNVIASPCAALFLSSSICNSTKFLRNVGPYGNISLFHHLQKTIALFRLSAAPINRNTKFGTCIANRFCNFCDTYFSNRCV